MAKKKYYAVAVGRQPGIYTQWFGNAGAQAQVIWVKGHAGNPANERCDQLATQAAANPNLPADDGCEAVCA